MIQKKILVGLSGGVDSAVAAYLLKEQGYDVSAGFMMNYLTDDESCPTRIDMAIAKEVAEYLEIPFFTFDFIEEYEKRVLRYIFEGYAKGLTPNPDVFCNTWIKFDLFREEALSYGFDAVATGHYVRLGGHNAEKREKRKEKREGICLNSPLEGGGGKTGVQLGVSDNSELGTRHSSLLRGIDPDKDQSYFLAALSREQLEQAIFPIGDLSKSEVRDIARKAGLPNAERKDSQGLCFVGKVNFSEFLKAHIPPKKGAIITTDGTLIGEHDGAFQYTIGQRKGICVGGGPALYVVEKNVETNTIIVGEENDPRLLRSSCIVSELNWLEDVALPLNCEAQIRYRQMPQKCTLTKMQNAKYKVQNVGDPAKGGEGSDEKETVTNSPLEGGLRPGAQSNGGGREGKKLGVSKNTDTQSFDPQNGGTPPNPLINEGESDSHLGNSELGTRNSSLSLGSDNQGNQLNQQNQLNCIQVSFELPQRAITPGQVCVFYDGDTVLGSGIIMP